MALTCKCVGTGNAMLFKNQDGTFGRCAVRKLLWSDGDEAYEYYHSDLDRWCSVPKSLKWKAAKEIKPIEPHEV